MGTGSHAIVHFAATLMFIGGIIGCVVLYIVGRIAEGTTEPATFMWETGIMMKNIAKWGVPLCVLLLVLAFVVL